MSCPEYRELMAAYIEGTLSPAEHRRLIKHAEQCPECRGELAAARRDESLLRSVLAPTTSAEEASEAVVDALDRPPQPVHERRWRWLRPLGMAAALALAAGIGFGMGRGGRESEDLSRASAGGPIQIESVRGTVLVQHGGTGQWESLGPGVSVALGTQFLVAPMSELQIGLEDKSTIRMGPNTQCALVSADVGLEFRLDYGQADLDLTSPHDPFAVSTPQGRIEALGTAFAVRVK